MHFRAYMFNNVTRRFSENFDIYIYIFAFSCTYDAQTLSAGHLQYIL